MDPRPHHRAGGGRGGRRAGHADPGAGLQDRHAGPGARRGAGPRTRPHGRARRAERDHRPRHRDHRWPAARPRTAGRLTMSTSPGALSPGEVTYWSVILLIGLVVIVAVVVLLSMLIAFVKRIDRHTT